MERILTRALATRQTSALAFGFGNMPLPNPDPVLKALGRDIQVYRDLRADPLVGGCVRRRKAAVKALEYRLTPGKTNSRVMDLCTAMLAALPLKRIISEMMDAALYGYQPLEVNWDMVDGLAAPVAVVGKPPEWFTYDQDNLLRFLSRDSGFDGILVPERKFLVARQDPSYDNPYGFADLSMCFWPVAFKKGGLKFWVRFAEKYGTPWLIGKHPRNTGDPETSAFLDDLEQMVQDAVAVIPDDSSVEIIESAGKSASGDLYERLLMYCRSEIAVALLGQNQTTEASANRASATAGLEVAAEIRDGDKTFVEDALNMLLRWYCELNFGDLERPTVELYEQIEVDEVQARRDKTLTEAGLKLTPSYFRRTYKLEASDIAGVSAGGGTVMLAEPGGSSTGEPDLATAQTDRLAQDAAPLVDEWVDVVRQKVNAATSLDELRDELLSAYPDMDGAAFAEVMRQALTAAALAGQYDIMVGL